jgi:uncharacterized oligopeptide transporter (OPT) family protein
LGWVGADYRVTALSVAAIVCVAASNGGTTSQDLKTGYLVGATPRSQQIGLLVGAFTSALVIGYTLNLLNNASTIYSTQNLPTAVYPNVAELTTLEPAHTGHPKETDSIYHVLHITEPQSNGPLAHIAAGKYLIDDAGKFRYLVDPGINGALKQRDDGTPVTKYEAPKARLMSLIIDGILTQKLPWGLVLLGVAMALTMELCGVASLPFAVGVYLPLSSSTPIFVGGVVRYLVDRKSKHKNHADSETSPGVLTSSGLIAGGAIAGIVLALISINEGISQKLNLSHLVGENAENPIVALSIFGILGLFLYIFATLKQKKSK